MFEHLMVKSGIILHKYWLEVSPEEQTRRLEGASTTRRKIWKLVADGPEVLRPLGRLHQGTRRMFAATDKRSRPCKQYQRMIGMQRPWGNIAVFECQYNFRCNHWLPLPDIAGCHLCSAAPTLDAQVPATTTLTYRIC